MNMIVNRVALCDFDIVTLAEMKNYLRVDTDLTADDNLIVDMITGAVDVCEALMNGTVIGEATYTQRQRRGGEKISLARQPVTEVISVTFNDIDDTEETLTENTDYRVLEDGIYPMNGGWMAGVFPDGRVGDGYVVNFKAGIATSASDVPTGLKIAIKRLVAFWYESREEYKVSGSGGEGYTDNYTDKIPSWLYSLLTPYMKNLMVL